MKIIHVFTLAAACAAVVTMSLGAAEPLLSPRAKANQIVTVTGVTEDRLDRANPFLHRGDLVAPSHVAGAASDRDLVREGRDITASPRALATFPHLADTSARAAKPAAACCKTMTKAECGMACCKEAAAKCGGTCCKS